MDLLAGGKERAETRGGSEEVGEGKDKRGEGRRREKTKDKGTKGKFE